MPTLQQPRPHAWHQCSCPAAASCGSAQRTRSHQHGCQCLGSAHVCDTSSSKALVDLWPLCLQRRSISCLLMKTTGVTPHLLRRHWTLTIRQEGTQRRASTLAGDCTGSRGPYTALCSWCGHAHSPHVCLLLAHIHSCTPVALLRWRLLLAGAAALGRCQQMTQKLPCPCTAPTSGPASSCCQASELPSQHTLMR